MTPQIMIYDFTTGEEYLRDMTEEEIAQNDEIVLTPIQSQEIKAAMDAAQKAQTVAAELLIEVKSAEERAKYQASLIDK